jgi:asparagine synthase (glutamine-hydrolysing)
MFQGVRKLRAGRYLAIEEGRVREETFWRLRYHARQVPGTMAEHAGELETVLRRSVRSHLAADVPVGALVSGGWDSSILATLAAEAGGARLKTFSIVFPDNPASDESRYSRLLAERLATEHHEIEFRAAQIPELMLRVVRHLEEPVQTAPAGLFYVLASLAAQHVKSVIGGEGADELFGGYRWVRSEAPYAVRKWAPRWACKKMVPLCPYLRARRVLRVLGAESDREADAEWRRPFDGVMKRELLKPEYRANGPDVEPALIPDEVLESCSDSMQRRLAIDFTGRLADGLLLIGDKVSMAHSLEVRMPYLDRAVVEFAAGLPSRFKVHRGREKRVLGEIARRLLPAEISQRRKQGLAYPEGMWEDRAARAFARQVLLESREGPFRREAIEKYLRPGGRAGTRPVTTLVFLQCWWNAFLD